MAICTLLNSTVFHRLVPSVEVIKPNGGYLASAYYSTLVPNEHIVDQTVIIASRAIGMMGEPIYIAEKVSVLASETDGVYTRIRRGIDFSTLLILPAYWDRIVIGEQVFIKNQNILAQE